MDTQQKASQFLEQILKCISLLTKSSQAQVEEEDAEYHTDEVNTKEHQFNRITHFGSDCGWVWSSSTFHAPSSHGGENYILNTRRQIH